MTQEDALSWERDRRGDGTDDAASFFPSAFMPEFALARTVYGMPRRGREAT